ncbi:mRNA decay activator protein ZFP36L1b [Genypterus blacodes]|uniref:mRNA decay activator protein ZFP36L1b n=1 Tax=Genypterus blacodes TaxID=154954 RepID=UPI003F7608AD
MRPKVGQEHKQQKKRSCFSLGQEDRGAARACAGQKPRKSGTRQQSRRMSASTMWPLMRTRDETNSLEESHRTPGSPSVSSCSTAESLLDTKVVGGPSARVPFHRRHSVSFPSQSEFSGALKASESSALLGSNKENRFRQRSCSEVGEGLRPGDQLCPGGSGQVNSSRYKTELCRPFEENGACKYGDKCQFAHGMHEVRSLSRHPKYKTELCRTFHSVGFCPYGPRCHFIHNAEERCGPPPPLSAFNKPERPRLQHSLSFAGFPSSGSPRDSPTSVTPPAVFSADPFARSGLFGPGLGLPPVLEPRGPAPFFQSSPRFFQSPSESPASPQDSLSDQEGSQSGSQSSSESSLLEASRRLPIFSTLSISDN